MDLWPDKDLGERILGDRVVQVDRRQKKITNESSFRAERGFGPGGKQGHFPGADWR